MPQPPEKPPASISPDRLWAEQLAIGMGLYLGILIFLAIAHPTMLSSGAAVLGPNYLDVYGWPAIFGILLQVIVHELGTIIVAWRLRLPLHFRLFAFGANATAILENLPRRSWTDAVVGLAGPLTGTLVSLILAAIYTFGYNYDNPHSVSPLFLGMACVGYFYNLITLVPILDLEGGWILSALAPPAWLLGLVACGLELTDKFKFNLVLLAVVAFGVPRFILLLTARAPRLDLDCTHRQRILVSLGYFLLVLILAYFGTTTFNALPDLIREANAD